MSIELLKKEGIVPVIKFNKTEDALPVLTALKNGGIHTAEITLRSSCALDAISSAAKASLDMFVGAGTVLNAAQAEAAADAGAQFIVSPGLDEAVVEWCLKKYTSFPGCVTPTEITKAISFGLKLIKFFPAEQYGGIKTLKALSAPFSEIKFMPTGGISLDNLPDYLALKCVECCGGSYLVKQEYIDAGESGMKKITELAEKSIKIKAQI